MNVPVVSSRRVRPILAGLAAVLALVLAYTAGVFSAGLYSPADDSPEAGFTRDMSFHHAQAVEMAMHAFQKASDSEVRGEGYDIATTQQAQIGMMKAWLDEWGVSRSVSDLPMSWMPGGEKQLLPGNRMPGMASDEELRRLYSLTGKDFDILFCQLMIRHHLGGIHMVHEVLKMTDNDDVVNLARSILDGQSREVTVFNGILTRLGAKPIQ